jgi:hypothetical protein
VGFAVVAERDVMRPTESAIAAHTSAADTAIHRRLLFASDRGQRAGSEGVLDARSPGRVS